MSRRQAGTEVHAGLFSGLIELFDPERDGGDMSRGRSAEEGVAIRQAATDSLAHALFVTQLWHERKRGACGLLHRQGQKKFGSPTAEQEATLDAIDNLDCLGALAERLLDVNTWDELLAE